MDKEEEKEEMNFLNTISVYLSGPITYANPEWRTEFSEQLERIGQEYSVKVQVYIPLEAEEDSPELIIKRDLEAIQRSDLVVAKVWTTTYGTPMEMFYAYAILKKPVLTFCPLRTPSPWIIGHSTKIYKTEKGFFRFWASYLKNLKESLIREKKEN